MPDDADMVMRFEDLEAWQLAMQVKRQVFGMTEAGPVTRDFEFRDQIRASSAAAPRLISEGFGRYRPHDFARLVDMALGELHETKSSVHDGADRKYFDEADVSRLSELIDRAIKVNTKFTVYLKSCREAPPPDYRRHRRPRKR